MLILQNTMNQRQSTWIIGYSVCMFVCKFNASGDILLRCPFIPLMKNTRLVR